MGNESTYSTDEIFSQKISEKNLHYREDTVPVKLLTILLKGNSKVCRPTDI